MATVLHARELEYEKEKGKYDALDDSMQSILKEFEQMKSSVSLGERRNTIGWGHQIRPEDKIGNKIKELRDEQGLLQRQLAAFLEIDTPMFSKIERGDRRAKREQVIKLAEYLHQDEKEMLTLWLADKFIDAVEDEQERDLCNDAIIVAQEKIKTM